MNKFTRYLLDTNVVSESRRANADTGVSWYFQAVDERHLHISALTIGELCKGAEMLRRKNPERRRNASTEESRTRTRIYVLGQGY